MLRSEIPYSDCTDDACQRRLCTPCGLGIRSCCRGTVACTTTRETHPCATRRIDYHTDACPVCDPKETP